MKTNTIILSTAICLAALTINGFAQIKSITKKEYDAAQRVPETNLEKKSYVSSSKNEEYNEGKLSKTSFINEETIPPKKMRYTEIETVGGKNTKLEIITVNYVEYRRENGGVWVKTDFSRSDENGSTGFGISGQESPNKKKYTVEEAKYNNQTVRIYAVSTVYDDDPNVLLTYKRWINSENLILKMEQLDTEISSGNVVSHSVETYEYNPKNLKIEAPVK